MSEHIKTGTEISIDCSPWLRFSTEDIAERHRHLEKQWVSLSWLKRVVEKQKRKAQKDIGSTDSPMWFRGKKETLDWFLSLLEEK